MKDRNLPLDRATALKNGISHYFTGKSCVNGHLEIRSAKSGHCIQCDRDRQKKRLAEDPVYRDLHRKSCRERMRRLLADPEKRAAIRARDAELHRTSDSRRAKKAAADRDRNQRESVKAKRRELQRKVYKSVYASDPKYIEARRERSSSWAAKNASICNAKTACRRAMRLQATPPWLTTEMKVEIQRIYNLARSLSKRLGTPHEVDHIIPLKSDVVCGLHVPWNLQVLSREENRSKANKLFEV